MARTAAQLLEDARKLPPGDRDWLVRRLVHESDDAPLDEIEAAWESEIERRLDEIDSDKVRTVPLKSVLARMDARVLAKRRG
jgi:putative addiction module component (TIGR02574 family)